MGHGGQILMTSEAAALIDGALAADMSLRDIGTYHLKDFAEPQRVHQLLAPGLPAEFPPLRSLGTLPSDLSVLDAAQFHPVPSFSGRDERWRFGRRRSPPTTQRLYSAGLALGSHIEGKGATRKRSRCSPASWRFRRRNSGRTILPLR
jgi:hypothetical protein